MRRAAAASRADGAGPAVSSDGPAVRRAALDLLARREHSFFELERKLRRRFPDVPADAVEAVLRDLRERGLQSDARFAESYAHHRKGKGFGRLHIEKELLARRVDSDVIDRCLDCGDEIWATLARTVAERKAERMGPDGPGRYRRLDAFLRSRGFSSSHIRQALDGAAPAVRPPESDAD